MEGYLIVDDRIMTSQSRATNAESDKELLVPVMLKGIYLHHVALSYWPSLVSRVSAAQSVTRLFRRFPHAL